MTSSTKYVDMPDVMQGAAYDLFQGENCPVDWQGNTGYPLPEYVAVRASWCAVGVGLPGGLSCNAVVSWTDPCEIPPGNN